MTGKIDWLLQHVVCWFGGHPCVQTLPQTKSCYLSARRVEGWAHYPPSFKPCANGPRDFFSYQKKRLALALLLKRNKG